MKKIDIVRKSMIYFKGVKKYLFIMTLFYVFIGVMGFIGPIVEANFITELTNVNIKGVILLALLFLVINVALELAWHFSMFFWKKYIRTKILFNIRKDLVENILDLQISNFDNSKTGFFQERIKIDPNIIARVVNSGQNTLINIITKLGVIVYVFFINWVLGLIYITGVILVTIVNNYTVSVSKDKNKAVRNSDEEVNSLLSEVIRGIRDIKLLNFKSSIKKVVIEDLGKNNNLIVEKDTFDSKMSRIERIILFVTVFLVVVVGIKFVDMGMLTAANLITLYLYNSNIFGLMSSISEFRFLIKDYELAMERIVDLKEDLKYPKDVFGSVHLDDFKGNIEFKDVSFGYNKTKVLNNLSFKIKAKDTVAIVGASGSGKSTILSLLTKSYSVGSGVIELDGVNINNLDEETIRNNISIISQNPYIFNMSIKDNLKLVKPNATIKELEEACKEASFYDFVMSLPKKFNTIIGEGGVNLSGGQRQRLAIARALLKTSKIILFDEATSALDNITQNEIHDAIDRISADYTIIIVAHRLSTIKNCKPIYILENGEIVDKGTHQSLLKRNKDYRKLYSKEIT